MLLQCMFVSSTKEEGLTPTLYKREREREREAMFLFNKNWKVFAQWSFFL